MPSAQADGGAGLAARPSLALLQPPLVWFGVGCSDRCAPMLIQRGSRRVLMLTSPSVAALGEPVLQTLRQAGLAVGRLTDIPPEPTVSNFEKVLSQAREFRPDGIIGLGGGSVLDVAKLAAVLHDRAPGSLRQCFGIDLVPNRRTTLVCLPTTAGTGSEVSPNAILLDEADHLKKGVVSPQLVPDAAFVDPLLTRSLPPDLTAATGIDALIHCIEAYANRFAHPLVDDRALQGIRLISAHLVTAVRTGDDLEARSAVALGSLLGGLCLGPVNTAGIHALAYPLGGEFHVAHGLANALLAVPVLRFNLPAAPARYAAIARALGVGEEGDDHMTATRGLARLDDLCTACGVPRRLRDCGVPAAALPRLAAAAMSVTRLLRNNPRALTADDAERIYREAF